MLSLAIAVVGALGAALVLVPVAVRRPSRGATTRCAATARLARRDLVDRGLIHEPRSG